MKKENQEVSVFICSGCSIGESLDCENLKKVAAENKEVSNTQIHNRLCHKEGLDLIHTEIQSKKAQKILIAACSPRAKSKEFCFDPSIQMERINLREQVVYCHPAQDEDTQMMAEDYLRMGLAKLEFTNVPTPFIPDSSYSDILVVGGGISGLTAALSAADAGYSVILVEKEANLGGYLNTLSKSLPNQAPWNIENEISITNTIREAIKHPDIRIITSSTVASINGQPGEFEVKIDNPEYVDLFHVGSIILASGWKPYDPSNLGHLGYGASQDVITSVDLEKMMKNDALKCSSSDEAPKSVLFIQCAGSRDDKHLPYCSNICCGTSLKQARMIRQKYPDCQVFIIYKDIRTPGMLEEYYKEVQKDSRIFLTKGNIEDVELVDKKIQVKVSESLIGTDISISVDMLVLATGMVPGDADAIHLNYRQGEGLPVHKYNFPDSHFICFPYETKRTGIYATGSVRAPMGINDSISDARGAVMKAIQTIKLVKKGKASHPRSGDMSFPQLYMQRCTDCKRCTEECPFGTYDETEKGTPLPNPTRCRRCGICMGACPERVISFEDFSIQSVSSMIKAIEVPDEFEEKPRVLAFVCENDAYPAFDFAGMNKLKYSPFVRIIPVRCIGSINKIWISDALSQGFDGILQIGCKPGDDYQCHFIHGSELNETRGENIQETLQTMMLEPERIRTEFVEINEYDRIPEIIDNYLEEIDLIGPNPFKEL